jgi:hypothetical protein
MARFVNLRRIERLEKKIGGTSWVESLSDAQLYALTLTIESGERPRFEVAEATGFNLGKILSHITRSCSNRPDLLDAMLDELQGLGTPNAPALLVEAVKAERLSAPYLWPDWRKELSEKVLAMARGKPQFATRANFIRASASS